MAASGKALITSDFPTPAEVASALGIPVDRAEELRQIAVEARNGTEKRSVSPAKRAKKK